MTVTATRTFKNTIGAISKIRAWHFNLPFNLDWWKKDEWNKTNGLTSPRNDAIILTDTRSQITASTISPVFWRPWLLVRPGFEPSTFHSADRCPPNWANRAAVTDSAKFFLVKSRIQGFGIRYSTQGIRFPTGIKEPGIQFLESGIHGMESRVNFRKISVRKTIWDLEFSKHLL